MGAPSHSTALVLYEAPPVPEMDDAERLDRLAQLFAAERRATLHRNRDALLRQMTSRPEPDCDEAAALDRLTRRERRPRHDAWNAILDAKLLAMAEAAASTEAMASAVGRTPAAVKFRLQCLRRAGVAVARRVSGGQPGAPKAFYDPEEDARIRAMVADGAGWAEIGRALGRTGDAVRVRAKRLLSRGAA